MSKNSAIEIYLRVKPTSKPFNGLNIREEENKCAFFVPKDAMQGYINNSKEEHLFEYNNILGMKAKQENVFHVVAEDVINSVLEGYNGTIFAYGQTGSGKTYTMTGAAEQYNNRGIIPRSVSHIFSEFSRRTDTVYNMSISYLEIYNNDGYDLLDENHQSKQLTDLPKVIPRENANEELILSGLSVHRATTEEDAINLLFIGDTNRVVCETPKNDASTRSHCIFIIQIEAKKGNSDVKTVSRLYLVDLSGSERIGKTEVTGKLQREARYINLSLHYLEQVIVCLNKKSQGEQVYVPYRNSLMTLVLRDAIGGNCKTKMIATISAEQDDIDESICTCRFAQRVALIKNALTRNEVVDPSLIIERLKKENAELKAEIVLLKGGSSKEHLDPEDIDECKKFVDDYLANRDPQASGILKERVKIIECFHQFRQKASDSMRKSRGGNLIQESVEGDEKKPGSNLKFEPQISNGQVKSLQDEIKRLQLLVQQRDNEILIFLNMLRNNKGNTVSTGQGSSGLGVQDKQFVLQQSSFFKMENGNIKLANDSQQIKFPEFDKSNKPNEESKTNDTLENSTTYSKYTAHKNRLDEKELESKEIKEVNNMLTKPIQISMELLKDRVTCFELFRKSYRKAQAIEEDQLKMKEVMERGKTQSSVVSTARNTIDMLKKRLEEIKIQRGLMGLVSGDNSQDPSPEEKSILQKIEECKKTYLEGMEVLKNLKNDYTSRNSHIENLTQCMQKDFEKWFNVMIAQRDKSSVKPGSGFGGKDTNSLNTSFTTTTSRTSKIKDKDVEKNLADFYKAREAIYNSQEGILFLKTNQNAVLTIRTGFLG